MSQEIEIEFKNIVSEADFKKLVSIFSVTKADFAKQTNHYFDTVDFKIKGTGSALRIREKNQKYTFTLKQPHSVGLLETHQEVSLEDLLESQVGKFPQGDIEKQLQSLNIGLNECIYLGSLTTIRAEVPYKQGTLVFDHSIYFDAEDFEIEFEAKDEIQGKKDFIDLLSTHNIPLVETENKIKRFFNKWKQHQ